MVLCTKDKFNHPSKVRYLCSIFYYNNVLLAKKKRIDCKIQTENDKYEIQYMWKFLQKVLLYQIPW